MKLKKLSEQDILEIDDCAPLMAEMPGVLQVYAGYGRSMRRLPDISQDGSLLILMDVAGSFVKECFGTFDVEKHTYQLGKFGSSAVRIEKVGRKEAHALSNRSVLRVKIFKVGSLLSSKYHVTLEICVGGSILNFAEYDASSAAEIFAIAKRTLGYS